jgi:hypothetical protein
MRKEPSCTRYPPNHSTSKIPAFISSIIMGMLVPTTRVARMVVSASSWFALPKRRCSWFERTKAFTTRTALRFSRMTRLSLSRRSCTLPNSGNPRVMTNAISTARNGNTESDINASDGLMDTAITMPPMHRIGARTSMRSSIITMC